MQSEIQNMIAHHMHYIDKNKSTMVIVLSLKALSDSTRCAVQVDLTRLHYLCKLILLST